MTDFEQWKRGKSGALAQYILQEQDDEIVCAIGLNFFHGARAGAGVGGLFTFALCIFGYRRLRDDQLLVDFEAGIKSGQRNPQFSRSVLLRGLRTQPIMTIGCIAFATTTLLKSIKFYLANRRCQEFALDDFEFAMLAGLSSKDPAAKEMFDKMFPAAGEEDTPSATLRSSSSSSAPHAGDGNASAASITPLMGSSNSQRGSQTAVDELLRHARRSSGSAVMANSSRQPPSFADGVAVGLFGTIFDCYTPQKAVYRYYGMRIGY